MASKKEVANAIILLEKVGLIGKDHAYSLMKQVALDEPTETKEEPQKEKPTVKRHYKKKGKENYKGSPFDGRNIKTPNLRTRIIEVMSDGKFKTPNEITNEVASKLRVRLEKRTRKVIKNRVGANMYHMMKKGTIERNDAHEYRLTSAPSTRTVKQIEASKHEVNTTVESGKYSNM